MRSFHGFLLMCIQLCSVSAQKPINILFVNDDINTAADKSFTGALEYMRQAEAENVEIGKLYNSTNNANQPYIGLKNICGILDEAVKNGSPPHIIIDTTITKQSTSVVRALSAALAIPTLSLTHGLQQDLGEWRQITETEKQYLVQIMPPDDSMVHIIRELVSSKKMNNAAVLYDKYFILDHHYKSLLLNLPCRLIMREMQLDKNLLENQLTRVRNNGISNYFILGNIDTISRILDIGEKLLMHRKDYSWFIITKELSEVPQCKRCQNLNAMFIKPNLTIASKITRLQQYQIKEEPLIDNAFYFYSIVNGIKAVGKMMQEDLWPKDMEIEGCSGYVENKIFNRNNLNYLNALKKIDQKDSIGPVIWKGNGMNANAFDLNILQMTFKKNGMVLRQRLGSWTTSIPPKEIKYTEEVKKAKMKYKIVTIIQPPFMMKKSNKNGKEEFYGYCKDLLDEIQKNFQFDYDIYEVADKNFGKLDEHNKWNGLIKELIDKKADIALAPLSVTLERELVVDYTVPYYELVGSTILMKRYESESSPFIYLLVLDPYLWTAILTAYIVTSILLWLSNRFSPYSYQNNKEKYKNDSQAREFTLPESMWFSITSMTSQGGGDTPKNASSRLVASTWWIFSFIIIAAYTANLAAFLTVSRIETGVHNLKDLSKQNQIQYAPLESSATMTYFERMAYVDDLFQEIYINLTLQNTITDEERVKFEVWQYPVDTTYSKMLKSIKKNNPPKHFKEALQRVRQSVPPKEGFAFIGDAAILEYEKLSNCDLQIVGEQFSPKPYALAVQKGSKLKHQLDNAIQKALAARVPEHLKEKWWNQNPMKKTCEDEINQSIGLGVADLGGVFGLILLGVLLSVSALLIEYAIYRRKLEKRPGCQIGSKVISVKKASEVPEMNKHSAFT